MNAMLAGKVVAVTGGGRGIGRAVVLACAAEGAAVVVNDPGVARDGSGIDAAPARAVADEIAGAGGRAWANRASLTEASGAQTVIDDALARFGRIDAVINCAGFLRDAIWHKLSRADWDAVVDVHLNGAFAICQAATPYFREQKSGAFVLFTSGAGLIGNVGQANYAAAKLGVVGLAQSIALDMARHGVRANCIAPVAWSRLVSEMIPDEAAETAAVARLKAMGPDKVAPLAVFLASDAAAGVSNQIFGVRGDEIALFSKPRPIRQLAKAEGWSAASIAAELLPAFQADFARADEVAGDVFG